METAEIRNVNRTRKLVNESLLQRSDFHAVARGSLLFEKGIMPMEFSGHIIINSVVAFSIGSESQRGSYQIWCFSMTLSSLHSHTLKPSLQMIILLSEDTVRQKQKY